MQAASLSALARPCLEGEDAMASASTPSLEIDVGALRAKRPPVMLLGGLSLIRPLGVASIPVVVATSDPSAPALSSRYVCGVCRLDRAGPGEEGAVRALLAAGQTLHQALGRKLPLFYGNDDQLSLVSRHRDRLARHYLFLLNDPGLTLDLLEKDRFVLLARRHQLPVPRSWSWNAASGDALAAAEGPLLIKPRKKTGWDESLVRRRLLEGRGKALVFRNGRELVSDAAALALRDALSVQDYIPGEDRRLLSFHGFVDHEGRLLAWFVGRKIRTYPPRTGQSSFLELVHDADLARRGHEIAARLGLKGVFKMDFKQDSRDGQLYLLEINARFNLWHYLGAANGINLPRVAYEYLVTGAPSVPAGYRTRYRWLNLPLDYKAGRELRALDRLSRWEWFLSILFSRKVHHLFLWRDPAPLFRRWGKRLSSALRRWLSTES